VVTGAPGGHPSTLGTGVNQFCIIITILGGAHHAEIPPLLPTGAINFLVGSKMLSPAGALANFARVFARVLRAGADASSGTAFGLRTRLNFLETLAQRAVPAAVLCGPFLSCIHPCLCGRAPDLKVEPLLSAFFSLATGS
jgi:hypothetical protein